MPPILMTILGVYLAACYLYGMYWVARLIWMRKQMRGALMDQVDTPVDQIALPLQDGQADASAERRAA